ncbi:MAG: tetratricopeptide repeat protein [Deltaproteobacteria bacterium]|nr:tetratricopeptide repeat protein [Deltaproteobacteria bacterium]
MTLLSASGCHGDTQKTPFSDALFALNNEAREALKSAVPTAERGRAELKRLLAKLGALRHKRGPALVAQLNAVMFDKLGYQRDLRKNMLEPTLLSAVLTRRVGSCTGLGALYLALGEHLGLELRGVLLPGHFYVRLGDIDIELLRHGAAMPPRWYLERYAPPEGARDYGRTLSLDESLAVFRYNLANAYRRAGKADRALSLYREVTRRLPGFAEAQAHLGRLLLDGPAEVGAQLCHLQKRRLAGFRASVAKIQFLGF